LETLDAPGTTGGLDSDLMSMGRTLLQALREYDFVLCNVKAPDLCGHDGNPFQKVEVIERIDAMLRLVLESVEPNLYIWPHRRPLHAMLGARPFGRPRAACAVGTRLRGDEVQAFHERACARGGLGRLRGCDLVPILTQLMGVQEKFGA
jgi:2,3-bisphosphoglycerate-independent phosphoglycerate mutase